MLVECKTLVIKLYLKKIKEAKINPKEIRLGVDILGPELLVFAVTPDQEIESTLMDIQKQMIKEGHKTFSTIMDEWDDMPLPSHYTEVE